MDLNLTEKSNVTGNSNYQSYNFQSVNDQFYHHNQHAHFSHQI